MGLRFRLSPGVTALGFAGWGFGIVAPTGIPLRGPGMSHMDMRLVCLGWSSRIRRRWSIGSGLERPTWMEWLIKTNPFWIGPTSSNYSFVKWTHRNAAAVGTHLLHTLRNGTHLIFFVIFHRAHLQKFLPLEWDPLFTVLLIVETDPLQCSTNLDPLTT
jgi:hypothetical protein